MLVIKSDNFASSSHLLCRDANFSWISEIPEKAVFADGGQRSFQELATIFGHSIEPFIPPNYKKSAEVLGSNPPWYFYIGKKKFITRAKQYSKKYSEFRSSFDTDQIEVHQSISSFLETLEPAKFNPSLVDASYEDHFKKSIQPHLFGDTLSVPKYTRTKTKTGRLSVHTGPNVLTMHSGLRAGLEGSHQIDFISMEPNFLLKYIGKSPSDNLYDDIRSSIFNDSVTRAKVKIATISALYGSDRSDKFAKTISDYFCLDKVVSELEQRIESDTIRNEYGRLIHLQGARGRHLLSLWLQSSATDGALYGFYNFKKNNDIKALWIIHDALIFIGDDKAISTKELDIGLDIKLPVKVDKI
jgi:hypothetical protein